MDLAVFNYGSNTFEIVQYPVNISLLKCLFLLFIKRYSNDFLYNKIIQNFIEIKNKKLKLIISKHFIL